MSAPDSFVDERAPEQIARAVERLTTELLPTTQMTENAFVHTRASFCRGASAAKFVELFAELACTRRPTTP